MAASGCSRNVFCYAPEHEDLDADEQFAALSGFVEYSQSSFTATQSVGDPPSSVLSME